MEPNKASLGSSNNGTLNDRALVFFPDYAVESKCPILGNEIMFIFCCVDLLFPEDVAEVPAKLDVC